MDQPIAIITGAGRGIGRETALLLGRQHGFGVVVVGRTKSEIDQAASAAGDALPIVADIANSADAKSEFDAKGGRGTPLLVVGGDVIQGLDSERIDAALRAHAIVAR